MPDQLPLFSTPTAQAETARPKPEAGGLHATASLKAAIVAWGAHLQKDGARLNTIKSFGGDLNLFANFYGAGKSLNQITTKDLERWLQEQRARGHSPKTYARRVTSLKSFFRWLTSAGVLNHDPAEPIIQQTVLSPLPLFLSEAEVERAREGARQLWHHADKPDLRPYLLFTLLIQTGIKKNECLSLELNHVDTSNPAEPILWIRYKDTRNRYKERKLALEPSWVKAYAEYLAIYQPEQKVFPYSPRRLEYLLEDVTVIAASDKHISFEMCRWTCAVRAAKAGLEFDRIREKLGLSKIQWREIGMKLKKLVEPAI